MTLGSHTEIERKFDVDVDTVVPSMRELPGVAALDDPAVEHLEAVYYDTAELDLAGAAITLRRRTGGTDAGWHLKLPLGRHERKELRLAAGSGSSVPAEMLDRTRVVRRDRPLVPVARVSTRREVYRLRDDRGSTLAELADDRVHAARLPSGPLVSWREWEVELSAGSPTLLRDASELLLRAGAAPPTAGSKLARVLGVGSPAARTPAPVRTAGDVLAAYLDQQAVQLRREDPLVRAGAPDSVHKMRVAARRARSVLATFAPLLEPGSWEDLSADLRWLGLTLGESRDAEVLATRMETLLRDEPDSPGRQAVSQRIASELAGRSARGESLAREVLDSDRYHRLLDSLESCATSPPLTGAAAGLEPAQVAGLVERDWKRLRRRARAAAAASSGERRDLALHEVRKAAKRLRYAAESAVPVLGDRARTVAASSTTLQDTLGEHHDSVVARALLTSVLEDVPTDEAGDRSFDRLHARESARATALEMEYEAAVDILMRGRPGAWLWHAAQASVPSQRAGSADRRADDEG